MITYKALKKYILSFLFIFLYISVSIQADEHYDPISVYLSWKKKPESTMSIQWISQKNETNNCVYYRKLDSEASLPYLQATASDINMPEGHPFLIHHVELECLEPGTAYVFKISENGVEFKFKTIPSTLTTLKFVEGGDVYHDTIDLVEDTNRQAARQNPDFAIIGGDIAYSADSSHGIFPEDFQRWMKWLIAWKNTMVTPDGFLIPILPAIGNHETSGGFNKTPTAAPFFYALFPMPGIQGYNVLDFGNYMSIIILDSGHTHKIAGKQTDWIENTLKSRGDIPYKFAVYHVPAYPSARKMSYEVSSDIRKNWVPVFDSYSLRAAFEHHDHTYKRTDPLKKGKKHPNGVVYLGDGAWGVANPRKPKRYNPLMAKCSSSPNFILVTLNEAGCKYEGINQKGEIIDVYTQKK
jgi:3',5'-cyclic AMP phosphodiesterase CpdA